VDRVEQEHFQAPTGQIHRSKYVAQAFVYDGGLKSTLVVVVVPERLLSSSGPRHEIVGDEWRVERDDSQECCLSGKDWRPERIRTGILS